MAETRTALVVEDDEDIRSLLVAVLGQAGFLVEQCQRGRDGIDRARELTPDLITLDLSLPDVDGIEVCREIRSFSDSYIVIISARGDEVDRLIGLEIGADDYLTKPFSPRELRARVAAMFRRPRSAAPPAAAGAEAVANVQLGVGSLQIDTDAREVRLDGQLIALTKIEFDLLAALATSPRRVFERESLVRMVWDGEWFGDDHVVDVHLANVRKKLGDDAKSARYVKTIRGVGYRFGDG